MASTLREELASLRIERREPYRPARGTPERDRGILLSALLWSIPLAILGGASYVGYRQYDKIRPRTEVTVAQVQSMTTGEAEKLLSAKGYVMSRRQAKIGSKVPGRIEQLLVEEGSKVKAGQILAVLEHNDIKALLESRRAQIKRSEAELLEAQVDLKDKERKAKREAVLLAHQHSSTEAVEQAEAARDMAAARVEALEAAIRLMKATTRETEETIRNMHIVASFNGTVVTKQAEIGETIVPGSPIVTLADLNQLEVEADITENLLSRLAPSQPAEISVTAVPDKHYRGRLRQIIPMSDRSRGTVKVKVQILDPDERLFPDLVATVHFLPDKAIDNPNASKVFRFVSRDAVVEENGHAHVWVVDRDQRVHKRRVEIVEASGALARVESGLNGGEKVVLQPPATLQEGKLIKEKE
jgi:RND family efflux transporter MFP subunit